MAGQEATCKKHDAEDYKPGCAKRIGGRVRKQPEHDACNETEAARHDSPHPACGSVEHIRHDETSIPPCRQILSATEAPFCSDYVVEALVPYLWAPGRAGLLLFRGQVHVVPHAKFELVAREFDDP